MRKEKGSVTVFLALVIVLILSFLFSLLEAARVQCLKSQATMNAAIVMQSMFGNYNENLWKDYHLLFLDGTWRQEAFSIEMFSDRAMEEAMKNLDYLGDYKSGERFSNLCRLDVKNIDITGYELATDHQGKVLRKQACIQSQKEAVVNGVDGIIKLKKEKSDIEENKEEAKNGWDSALGAIEQAETIEAEKAAAKESEGTQTESGETQEEEAATEKQESEEVIENPMEYVASIKNASILALVMENPSELSVKAVETNDFLAKRNLETGNLAYKSDALDMDRLWFQYYISQYFSNCAKNSEKGPKARKLEYEMEYIIGGKTQDSENLEKVVNELLLIREASNFITLQGDSGKKSLAMSIATAAVGFTGIVPLIRAVQIGILLAWAYVESILDVRALLAGKKVPLKKTISQWKSDLKNCHQSIDSGEKADEDAKGWDYGAYLQILMLLLSDQTLNYRCMDLMERNLRLTEGNSNLRMDAMIQTVEANFSYDAKPLFWNLIFVSHSSIENISFHSNQQLSYGVR